MSVEKSSTTVEWRTVVGFPDYEVSDDGHVQRVTRAPSCGARRPLPYEIRQHADTFGYLRVYLYLDTKKRTKMVHSLVLRAFTGPLPSGMHGCHDDGDKTNNCLSNLFYKTPLENIADQFRHGTFARGDRKASALLTDEQAREIKSIQTFRYGDKTRLAEKYGVDSHVVSRVVFGRTWKHILAKD